MKKLNLFILAILLTVPLYAGESYFGLINNGMGNLQTPYSGKSLGRSFGIASKDSLQVNYRNYAGWTGLPYTTITVNGEYGVLYAENQTRTSQLDNANFKGAALGIPIKPRKWILGLNIQPYTNIEQRLKTLSTVDSNEVTQNIFMHGGLSRANILLAWKAMDRLSVSLAYEYTFGLVSEDVLMDINDNFASRLDFTYRRQVNGHGLVLSMQAEPLKGMGIGFLIRPAVKGTLTKSGDTPSTSLNGDVEESIQLPAEYNFGFEYKAFDRYSFGTDFIYQDWKNEYKINGQTTAGFAPFYRLGVGVERAGSPRRFVNYSQIIDWRFGLFYSQLPFELNKANIKEVGVTLGTTLPLIRFRSKLDIYLNVSKRGDLTQNNLQEWVVRFGLSISANELWFVNVEN